MLLKKIIFIAFVGLFLFSCSKDEDDQKPTIVITSPTHLQNINGIDTLRITGTITDNIIVETVSISLRDDNNIAVLSTIVERPNVSDFDLSVFYFFDDLHLASGTYYFDITAFDGVNTTRKYIDISYNGVPITRENVFIFDNVSNTTSIYQLDNGLNASIFKTLTGDFMGSAVNSYDQQLINAGTITGKVSALDAKNGDELWNVPLVNSPPTPYFTSMFYDDETVYVGYYDGNIRWFRSNGTPIITAQAYTGYYCERGLVHEDMLFTEQNAIANNDVRLIVYWTVSAVERQQITINEDIVGMYSLNTNEVVLLSNDVTNNGKLAFYNISANSKSSPFSIGSGKIDASIEISTGVYLVARNGDLVIVNANNFSTLPFLSGVNATLLKYDDLTNELFVVDGNTLTVYDYSSKTIIGSYSHTNPILGVEFLYNK
jgi:hypothetical protein